MSCKQLLNGRPVRHNSKLNGFNIRSDMVNNFIVDQTFQNFRNITK